MEDTQDPAEHLPEAFKNEAAQDGPAVKKLYDNDPTAGSTHTSTGMNVADEGSAESFPTSDPPSHMAAASPVDAPPSNTDAPSGSV